jgi:hypothetical protein
LPETRYGLDMVEPVLLYLGLPENQLSGASSDAQEAASRVLARRVGRERWTSDYGPFRGHCGRIKRAKSA